MTISHDISFWKEPPPESAAFNACVTAFEESTLLAPVNSGKASGPHGGPLPLSSFVPAWTHVLPSSRHFLNKNARYARCGPAASTNVSNLRNTTDALLFRPRQSYTHASSYKEWVGPLYVSFRRGNPDATAMLTRDRDFSGIHVRDAQCHCQQRQLPRRVGRIETSYVLWKMPK